MTNLVFLEIQMLQCLSLVGLFARSNAQSGNQDLVINKAVDVIRTRKTPNMQTP